MMPKVSDNATGPGYGDRFRYSFSNIETITAIPANLLVAGLPTGLRGGARAPAPGVRHLPNKFNLVSSSGNTIPDSRFDDMHT